MRRLLPLVVACSLLAFAAVSPMGAGAAAPGAATASRATLPVSLGGTSIVAPPAAAASSCASGHCGLPRTVSTDVLYAILADVSCPTAGQAASFVARP